MMERNGRLETWRKKRQGTRRKNKTYFKNTLIKCGTNLGSDRVCNSYTEFITGPGMDSRN